MGIVLSIIGIGIASAEITKKTDKVLYGDGDRGCNGKLSKSHANIQISNVKTITRAQALLRPEKYTEGAGFYFENPKTKKLTKLPNKFMPNSCRQDCSYGTRFVKGIARQFTHIDDEGMIKRLFGEPCVWKTIDKSCEGVDCSVYRKIAEGQYIEIAEKEQKKWAKKLEAFAKTPLGKFLSVVPIVGSELEILFKDIKGERPSVGDWVNFGVDIAFALVPGGAGAVEGFKMAKGVVQGIAKAGFKTAVKAGSKALVKGAAKKMVRDIYTNPEIRKFWVQTAIRSMEKTAMKKVGRALTPEDKKHIATFVEQMMNKRNLHMMEKLITEAERIPDKYYLEIKDESGMGKFESESRAAAKKSIKAGKKPKDIENAYIHFGYQKSMYDKKFRMKKSDMDPNWGALAGQGKDGWLPWGVDIFAQNPHRTKRITNWTIIAQKVDELTNRHFLGEQGAKDFKEFQKKRKTGKLLEDPEVKKRIKALQDAQKKQDQLFRDIKAGKQIVIKKPKKTVKQKIKKGIKEIGDTIVKGAKTATKETLKEIGKEAGKEIIKTIIKP